MSFDAIVAYHSMIHVPRSLHEAFVSRISSWLKPSGPFLATWPLTEWEGREENWDGWGASMWWSHFDTETYLRILQEAGFSVAKAARRTSGEETWLWVLARRDAA